MTSATAPTAPVASAAPAALGASGDRVPESTSTRTVDRALDLLAQVCAAPSISLSECARRADLPTSTALRLLRTLERSQFVTRAADGNYTAGTRLIHLGVTALSRESVVPLAAPALHRLVGTSGETAYVSIPGPAGTALYAGMVEGTHPVRHAGWVGRTIPVDGTAVGAALSGRLRGEQYVAVRSAVEPEVTAIAAPIRGHAGIVGALSLVGPTHRMDDSTIPLYGAAIALEAAGLTRALGGATPAEV
ncbi:IclR family transcriptional regulator [Nakamurella silvestris]|nr:IclR family transcriptional regulator [Nakamurella silvestris]